MSSKLDLNLATQQLLAFRNIYQLHNTKYLLQYNYFFLISDNNFFFFYNFFYILLKV